MSNDGMIILMAFGALVVSLWLLEKWFRDHDNII